MSQVLDPFDSATEAGERPDAFFGKMEVSAQFVKLVKGQGKQAWIDGADDPKDRRTEVAFVLNPLDCTGLTRTTERNVIAESREWSKIVWPSLRELGIKNVREVNGKFAHVEAVPQSKDSQYTTLKFVGLYNTEAECVAAWEKVMGQTAQPRSAAEDVPFGNEQPQVNEVERNAAMGFLPHIVNANKHDLTALAKTLASMEPLNKYFTVDSPEVQELLKAA